MQVPFAQLAPAGQSAPQRPQFDGSLPTAVQPPPQHAPSAPPSIAHTWPRFASEQATSGWQVVSQK